MEILSFYIIESYLDTPTKIGAFLSPFYAGDNVHYIIINNIEKVDYWPEELLFKNYKEAYKQAFIDSFGIDAYTDAYEED